MFLPIGDYPNPPKPQWVTRILIALNVAVYLFVSLPLMDKGITAQDLADPGTRATLDEMFTRALPGLEKHYEQQVREGRLRSMPDLGQMKGVWLQTVSQYDLVVDRYGYKPGRPSLWALLLCMFLHAGFMHLFGNMLYLWIYGDNVEYRLGPVAYLISYLGTGMVATVAFSLFNASSMAPLVGASGAISGVLGFYLIWFPYNYVRVFVFIVFFIQMVHVRAVFVLLFYLVIDNLVPFLWPARDAGGGGVAYAAHIGGFVAGLVAALLFNRARGLIAPPRPVAGRVGARPGPSAREIRVEVRQDHTSRFAHSIEHSQMEDAAHAFARIAREGGTPPQEKHVFVLGNWLYENGFVKDSLAVFRYYLKHFPRGEDLDRVNLGMGILLSRRLGQPAGARQYLLAAIDLTPEGSGVAEIARDELKRIEQSG